MKQRLAVLLIAFLVALAGGVVVQKPAYAFGGACQFSDTPGNYYVDDYKAALWHPAVYDSYWHINRNVRADLRSWRYDSTDGRCMRAYRVSEWTDDGHCCIDMQSNLRTWVCGTWAGQFTTTTNRGTFGEVWTQWNGPTNVWVYVQVSPTEAGWVSFYDYATCGPQADNWNTWADGEGTWSTDPSGVYAYGPPLPGPSAWYCNEGDITYTTCT